MTNGIDHCINCIFTELLLTGQASIIFPLKEGYGKFTVHFFGQVHGIHTKITTSFG